MNIVDVLLNNSAKLNAIITLSWKAPGSTLASALGIAGQRRIVGGNNTLDVTTVDRIWLVLSGSVEIFLVDRYGRYPFLSVEAGGLIDSLPAGDEFRFIGVPSADTEIVETTRKALWELASNVEARPALEQARNGWLALLAPWQARPSSQDPGLALAERAVRAAIASRAGELAQNSAAHEASRLAAEGDFATELGNLVDLISIKTAVEGSEETETIGTIAARVARALGHPALPRRRNKITPPPLARAIDEIARDNHLQYRELILEGRWWEGDLGPLLATVGPESAPCALIRSGNRYLCYGRGAPQAVDAKTGATINRTAYAFYIPLPDGMLTGWRLLRFGLHNCRADVLAIIATMVLTGLFSLASPMTLGWLLDPIIPDAELDQVGVISGLLLLLALGMTSTNLVESLSGLRLEARADNRIQAAVWIKLLNLPVPFFRGFTAGDLASRADSINVTRKLISRSIMTVFSGAVSMIFSVGLMLYFEWRVTLLLVLVSVLFAGVAYLIGKSILSYNFESLELSGKQQGTVLQLLGAIAKLRVAGAEREAFLVWLRTYRRTVTLSLRQSILSNCLSILRSGFGPLLTVVVLVVLGAHSGNLFAFFRSTNDPRPYTPLMSVAEFASFNVALGQFVSAVMSLTRASLFIVILQAYFQRVRPILEAKEERIGQGSQFSRVSGEIELRDVRFRYAPDAPLVLKGLSMRIPAERFVALVGSSGAGKSSIIRLLLGFDVPESGNIYLDGTDLRFVDLRDMRRQYGVVLQNGRLLAGSIYDNIAAGLPLSEDEAMEALRIAALDDVVKDLPMGLHTAIAEGGMTFSGGQRQRLLIARAVTRKPRVVIMDEATSALDNVTQRRVMDNLRSLRCTRVAIAQRMSTLESADLIYVINDGRIAESGSYLELLQKGRIFKRLAQRQLL
ncbi:ATP-binding cassette domain-containing protein [Mesorhizobium sp. M0152]|uniref:ATP-binding cassette domain-containing protein n=1 Tax=Mesorhizobium sp. M0152 TaxID=2956898 RepID=UPI00333B3D45